MRIKTTNANEPLMRYRKDEDDVENRCAGKRGGTCIEEMSRDGNLFISLYGVRYLGGVSFILGQCLEQGNAVCPNDSLKPQTKNSYQI